MVQTQKTLQKPLEKKDKNMAVCACCCPAVKTIHIHFFTVFFCLVFP